MLHQYKNNGYNIVLDVNSGSVHVVDELMYDAMELGEKLIGEIDAPITLSEETKTDIKSGLKNKYSDEEIDEAYRSLLMLRSFILRIPMSSTSMILKREKQL